MLTKAMLSGLTPEQIELHPAGWYEARGIVQILDRQITSVDTEKKEIVLDGDFKLPYTKLIFALGSESFIPPIPGHEKEGVVAIRRISDVAKVQAMGNALKNARLRFWSWLLRLWADSWIRRRLSCCSRNARM